MYKCICVVLACCAMSLRPSYRHATMLQYESNKMLAKSSNLILSSFTA